MIVNRLYSDRNIQIVALQNNSGFPMLIKKIVIENYKCFKGKFTLSLQDGLNILVGNNEAGKSTIIEAIHIALSGLLNGRYLKNELSQYLFNYDVEKEYIESLKIPPHQPPPNILIEIYFENDPLFEGDKNSENINGCGLFYKIEFDEEYRTEYENLIATNDIKSIPIEYYKVTWESFARRAITARSIPIKSALIDSASSRFQNGSDLYISRIIKDDLTEKEKIDIAQAYRKMKDTFKEDPAIIKINSKIQKTANISDKEIEISVDLSSRNAWETSLITYLSKIPFHQIGKGEQCIIKTNLALGHKKSQEANIILLEEPENHLSYSKLNYLIKCITESCHEKQIIISTHSSFVINKLGLENIILINENKTFRLSNLTIKTKEFFKKLAGYNTLRLILCKKAILVEGDSDELIVQKAYMDNNNGKLPIEDEIDIISVGTSFLRFLEIADRIDKPVAVVTDNDGSLEKLKTKFRKYENHDFIKIFYDEHISKGSKKGFNYNTLEPKLFEENEYDLDLFNRILETEYNSEEDLLSYMKTNKTSCALKFFETQEKIQFPKYILDAIK